MLRRIMAVLPIVIIATFSLSEGSAQAILPSRNYGGLLIHSNRGIPQSAAATNFTVPALDCSSTSSTTTGIVLGSGIYSAKSNWVSAGGIDSECQGAVAVYSAQVILDNDVTTLSVTPAAGDAISTSVSIVPGQTQVTVDDITQNSSTTMTVPGGSIATYLLLGADVDRNPGVTGIPNFGKVKFTNASFNGVAAGKATGVKVADLYSAANVLEATSSQPTNKGTGFGLTFVNSGVSTGITCSKLSGSENSSTGVATIKLKTCTGNTGASGKSTGPASSSSSTVKWQNGKTTSFTESYATGSGCPSGDTADEVVSGSVTADTTGSTAVGAAVSAEICESPALTFSLAPGTQFVMDA